MANQSELLRMGVYFEYMELNCWRVTGERSFIVRREERESDVTDFCSVWTVFREGSVEIVEFDTAGSALAEAYARAREIALP